MVEAPGEYDLLIFGKFINILIRLTQFAIHWYYIQWYNIYKLFFHNQRYIFTYISVYSYIIYRIFIEFRYSEKQTANSERWMAEIVTRSFGEIGWMAVTISESTGYLRDSSIFYVSSEFMIKSVGCSHVSKYISAVTGLSIAIENGIRHL